MGGGGEVVLSSIVPFIEELVVKINIFGEKGGTSNTMLPFGG